MRPSIRQLEYLVAVADELHFGRAARACAVTQPALSTQIQQLEDLLGMQLFERSRRGVIVTPLGEEIVERARAALREIDSLRDVSQRMRPMQGSLRLGVIPTIAPYVLPGWLSEVRAAFPELQVWLREDQTERIVALLDKGSLDLLLLALPAGDTHHESMLLFQEPFVLAVPPTHRLASPSRREIRESELEGEEVLLLEDGHCFRDQALEVCSRAGARESARIRATSLNTLAQMTASGLGITLLPASAVPTQTRDTRDLVIHPFAPPIPTREVGLLWRGGSAREEEFRMLGEFLRERPPV
jgi:LysR family hydrogen peroxide-inducible transcriptional activator